MLELVEKELNNHHSSNDLAGECIKCFVGNVTEAKPENLVDCDNLGIQREELYCRNITIYQNGEDSPIESVQRSCVAMSWYVNVNPNHYYWTLFNSINNVTLFTYTNNYSPLLGGSNFGFPASNRFFPGK